MSGSSRWFLLNEQIIRLREMNVQASLKAQLSDENLSALPLVEFWSIATAALGPKPSPEI